MTTKTWRYFWGSSFLKSPLQNGVGRYVPQLLRVTLRFCKSTGSSKGMRDYIEKELINFARENPSVVVYLKPRRHRGPALKAEYLNGGEEWVSTRQQSCEDIKRWMEHLRGRAGYTTQHLRKQLHTDHPSIQGPWTPWTHRDPLINLAKYPDEKLSAAPKPEPTATDQLIELYEKQKLSRKAQESA